MSEDMAAALISVLRSHGCEGTVHDGVVWGRDCYSRRLVDGESVFGEAGMLRPGERLGGHGVVFGAVWERVGSSGAEVRDWLGY